MKKIVVYIFIFLIFLSLEGCGGPAPINKIGDTVKEGNFSVTFNSAIFEEFADETLYLIKTNFSIKANEITTLTMEDVTTYSYVSISENEANTYNGFCDEELSTIANGENYFGSTFVELDIILYFKVPKSVSSPDLQDISFSIYGIPFYVRIDEIL